MQPVTPALVEAENQVRGFRGRGFPASRGHHPQRGPPSRTPPLEEVSRQAGLGPELKIPAGRCPPGQPGAAGAPPPRIRPRFSSVAHPCGGPRKTGPARHERGGGTRREEGVAWGSGGGGSRTGSRGPRVRRGCTHTRRRTTRYSGYAGTPQPVGPAPERPAEVGVPRSIQPLPRSWCRANVPVSAPPVPMRGLGCPGPPCPVHQRRPEGCRCPRNGANEAEVFIQAFQAIRRLLPEPPSGDSILWEKAIEGLVEGAWGSLRGGLHPLRGGGLEGGDHGELRRDRGSRSAT